MRNATVMDDDGAAEYAKVKLSPSNWQVLLNDLGKLCLILLLCRAWIAQQKATGGPPAGTRTVEQITWEIQALQKRCRMLEVLRDVIISETESIMEMSSRCFRILPHSNPLEAFQRIQRLPTIKPGKR